MSNRTDIEVSSLSAIEHIIEHRPERVRTLRIPHKGDGRVAELEARAKEAGIKLEYSLSKGKSDSAIAVLPPFEYVELPAFLEEVAEKRKAFVLALDHLQDPQNLGAICRSAEGLGLDGVLLPKDRSVGVSAGAYNASVGAVETLPIISVGNLGEALRKLKKAGFWIVGSTLSPESKEPETVPDFDKMVLVLGSELEGMAPTLEKVCDWQVKIPLTGQIQSLNVSAAGAILMYALLRRQRAT